MEVYYKPTAQPIINNHGNMMTEGLSKSYTYDTLQNDYNNSSKIESLPLLPNPKPLSQMKARANNHETIIDKLTTVNENNKNISRERSYQTISYDSPNIMPSPNKSTAELSPQRIGLKSMKNSSSGRLHDSLDTHINSSSIKGKYKFLSLFNTFFYKT